MKKVLESTRKLKLYRETIASLSRQELADVMGGLSYPAISSVCTGHTSNGPYACHSCDCM